MSFTFPIEQGARRAAFLQGQSLQLWFRDITRAGGFQDQVPSLLVQKNISSSISIVCGKRMLRVRRDCSGCGLVLAHRFIS